MRRLGIACAILCVLSLLWLLLWGNAFAAEPTQGTIVALYLFGFSVMATLTIRLVSTGL